MRSEAVEQYNHALKAGQKYYKNAVIHGEYPYPLVLDDIIQESAVAGYADLGIIQVPSDRFVGTKSAGRTAALAGNFMPLLEPTSEFAAKWISLCDAHLSEEGIRDAVECYEFLGRFYIQEGNKRLSVLLSYDSPRIAAHVRRVIPRWSEDHEVQVYYEFMHFYSLSGLYGIDFRHRGSYAKLQAALGFEPEHVWTDQERRSFSAGFSHFRDALQKQRPGQDQVTPAEALLTWLQVFSFSDIKDLTLPELSKRIDTLWPDMLAQTDDTAIELWNGLIERVPDYAAAYALRQEAAFYGRNAGLVIEDFWNVVDMIPDYPKAYVYAAKVYNIYERSDLFDEMLQVAEKNGINSMALSLEHAKKLKREKDYTAAKEIFQKLMPEMDSEACDIENPSEFYNEYAMTLYNLGRQQKDPEVLSHLLKESMVITEKSISINDLSRQAHWIKTDILEALKEDAAPEYENMLQLFSDDPDVFYEYGMYLKRQKKKDEALKYFEKTLVLDEGHASAHEKISDYYLDSFADTEDMADYRAAVDHSLKQLDNQANAYFYISLGLVYIEGNEFEKALEAGTRAVEDDPGDIYAYNVVAYSLMMLKRYDEAEEAFKKGNALLEGNPINTALQRNYIRFLEMRRRYSEAIDYALAYHEQFHLDNTGTHETMAKLYKRNH